MLANAGLLAQLPRCAREALPTSALPSARRLSATPKNQVISGIVRAPELGPGLAPCQLHTAQDLLLQWGRGG